MKRQSLTSALVCLACLVCLTSCGKTLTRARAAELIESQQRLPRAQTITVAESYLSRELPKSVRGFGTVTLCINDDEQFSGSQKDRLIYFQSQGLINIGFTTVDGSCPAVYAKVSLTDSGRKYLVSATNGKYQLRTGSLVLDQVTGIVAPEQGNVATADYTVRLTQGTPFGAGVDSSPKRETASFVLYDDGWRIQPASMVGVFLSYDQPADTPSIQQSRRAVGAAEALAQERMTGETIWALQPAASALLKQADTLHGSGDDAGALEAYMGAVAADSNAADFDAIRRYAPSILTLGTNAPPPPPPPRPGTPHRPEPPQPPQSRVLAAVRQYLQVRPDDWSATTALVLLVDLPEGESLLAPVLKARPRDPEPYALRAAMLKHHQRFLEAVANSAKAAELDPNNPERYMLVGSDAYAAVTKGTNLTAEQRRELIRRGLTSLERAESLRAEYFESITYRSLLLRQLALLEADAAARSRLISEADQIRSRAIEIVRRRRGS